MITESGERILQLSLMYSGHLMIINFLFGIGNGEVQIFNNTGNF